MDISILNEVEEKFFKALGDRTTWTVTEIKSAFKVAQLDAIKANLVKEETSKVVYREGGMVR